jgi:hypothetical protein
MNTFHLRILIPFISLTLALTACGGETAQTTATPTPTPDLLGAMISPSGQEEAGSESPDENELEETGTLAGAACLLDAWELDNDTYLTYLRAITEGVSGGGRWDSVDGSLHVTFDAEGMVTNTTQGFSITLCSPDGCLAVPVDHDGTVPFAVEGDQLAIEGGMFVTATIDASPLGPHSETVPTDSEAAPYTCSNDLLTIFPAQGFPELVFHRVAD